MRAEFCLELSRIYSHLGQWTEAETVLTQGLQLPPNHFTIQLNTVLAEIYYQKGQYNECISHCELTLTTEKGNGPMFELLKALYFPPTHTIGLGMDWEWRV